MACLGTQGTCAGSGRDTPAVLAGTRGHANRDTRADAHGVQASQAPRLGPEAPWTRAAPPVLSPPLSSRCPASRPGHVLLCAQRAPTEATTARVLYARVAVGVRAGADVHHSVCASTRGSLARVCTCVCKCAALWT